MWFPQQIKVDNYSSGINTALADGKKPQKTKKKTLGRCRTNNEVKNLPKTWCLLQTGEWVFIWNIALREKGFSLMLLLTLWVLFSPFSLSLENEKNFSVSLWAPCCCSVLVSGDAWAGVGEFQLNFSDDENSSQLQACFYKKWTNWCHPVVLKHAGKACEPFISQIIPG